MLFKFVLQCFGTCPGGKDYLPITLVLLATAGLSHLPSIFDFLGSASTIDFLGSTGTIDFRVLPAGILLCQFRFPYIA